jgi:hypothetical protein
MGCRKRPPAHRPPARVLLRRRCPDYDPGRLALGDLGWRRGGGDRCPDPAPHPPVSPAAAVWPGRAAPRRPDPRARAWRGWNARAHGFVDRAAATPGKRQRRRWQRRVQPRWGDRGDGRRRRQGVGVGCRRWTDPEVLPGHEGRIGVLGLRFSWDGRTLYSAGPTSVIAWDLQGSGRLGRPFRYAPAPRTALPPRPRSRSAPMVPSSRPPTASGQTRSPCATSARSSRPGPGWPQGSVGSGRSRSHPTAGPWPLAATAPMAPLCWSTSRPAPSRGA